MAFGSMNRGPFLIFRRTNVILVQKSSNHW